MTNPFMLERVGAFGGLVVYDGESVDGDFSLRCIAVGHDGDDDVVGVVRAAGRQQLVRRRSTAVDPWVVDVGRRAPST